MPSNSFFSHETALLLCKTPLPAAMEHRMVVHVSVVAPRHPPQMDGVVGHRLSAPPPVKLVSQLPVLSPAMAWCQLAGSLSPLQLVVAGDHLVRRKTAVSSMDELALCVLQLGSARGARAMRDALTKVRPGTDSPRETVLRRLVVDGGLPEPVIGFAVFDRGAFIATPDLAYVKEKIALEYEGEIHRTDPRVYADDIIRRELLEAAGWLVIRVTKDHLASRTGWLLDRVATALRERSS
jgi:hypothetical protein